MFTGSSKFNLTGINIYSLMFVPFLLPLLLLSLPLSAHPTSQPNPPSQPKDITVICTDPTHTFAISSNAITTAANTFLTRCSKTAGSTFPHLGERPYQTRRYSGCYRYASFEKAVLTVCLDDGMNVEGAKVLNKWDCGHAAAAWILMGDTARCPGGKGKAINQAEWVIDGVGRLMVEHADLADGSNSAGYEG